MKLVTLSLSSLLMLGWTAGCLAQGSQAPATSAAPVAPTSRSTANSTDRCVQHTAKEVREELKSDAHPSGPHLASTSYFMPAGAAFKVGLNEPHESGTRYYAYIDAHSNEQDAVGPFMEGGEIGASEVASDDALVTSGQLQKSATLLTLNIPASVGGLWSNAELFVWKCAGGRPMYVSRLTIRTSSSSYSSLAVWPTVLLLYLLAALATRAMNVKKMQWYRYLDPVYLTAGSDGKGSLSKLQILFFSLIVFGLLSYIVARTGVLSDLSSSVLLLLGIAGVGAAAAKGTDEQKNRLSVDNRLWLMHKGWLTSPDWAAVNEANWHDIVTNDGGEFDVYRYQSCIFSLAVGGALLVGGVNELASFSIPQTLLGILGLSQIVYVGGKLVTTSSVGELESTLNAARTAEKTFGDAVLNNPDPAPAQGGSALDIAIRRAGKVLYLDYIGKAKSARDLFGSLTGLRVKDEQLAPTLPL